MLARESHRSWIFDVRRSMFKLEWPRFECRKVRALLTLEIGHVKALAAKYSDVANDLRAFQSKIAAIDHVEC